MNRYRSKGISKLRSTSQSKPAVTLGPDRASALEVARGHLLHSTGVSLHAAALLPLSIDLHTAQILVSGHV